MGLQFAKALAAKVQLALQNMDADITTFGQVINAAIEETERLISSQRKVNKGLEDMKGAIIEVSEDSSEIRETGKEYTLSVLPSNVVILED